MTQYVFKMPDLGEGTVEAEIVAWHTKPGDVVTEDQLIVDVMTDKAAVEVPAPVGGRVLSINGQPGDKIAVGSPLIVFETAAAVVAVASGAVAETAAAPKAAMPATAPRGEADAARREARAAARAEGGQPEVQPAMRAEAGHTEAAQSVAPATAPRAASRSASGLSARTGRVMTSPANRRRAHEAGIDLSSVAGSGPGGRILRGDLAAAGTHRAANRRATSAQSSATPLTQTGADVAAETRRPPLGGRLDVAAATSEIKVIGIRRLIAERMSEAKRTIPHFAYVEEVDVTELESLRQHLNATPAAGAPTLTFLPLVVLALTRVLESFPQCNVLYDATRGVLVRHRAVHVGIATQTPDGLKVPVVRNAQSLGLWEIAAEIRRIAGRARENKATRDELVGSTITVTSLGKLGGIASTPIINAPEVAIIGLNKAVDRPVVRGGDVVVRRIMNLSSSFDHRFVDGYDAAAMIQALKEFLEHPATIFIPR